VALRRLGDVPVALLENGQEQLTPLTAAAVAVASHLNNCEPDLVMHDLIPADYAQRFEATPLLVDRRPELFATIAHAHARQS